MRVSVSIHTAEPDQSGNQQDHEARYGGYNRQYAELMIDPTTGNGSCILRGIAFPSVQSDPEEFTHFSIGVCLAAEGYGGAIISAGPLGNVVKAPVGSTPFIGIALCGIYREKLEFLNLIHCDDGRWVEKTEEELRQAPAVRLN